jgi:hypothetical protein
LQIDGGPSIAVTADRVKLTQWNPVGSFNPRLRLEFEFDLTPEFSDWWHATTCPQALDHASGSCELCDGTAARAALALSKVLQDRAAARTAGGDQR